MRSPCIMPSFPDTPLDEKHALECQIVDAKDVDVAAYLVNNAGSVEIDPAEASRVRYDNFAVKFSTLTSTSDEKSI